MLGGKPLANRTSMGDAGLPPPAVRPFLAGLPRSFLFAIEVCSGQARAQRKTFDFNEKMMGTSESGSGQRAVAGNWGERGTLRRGPPVPSGDPRGGGPGQSHAIFYVIQPTHTAAAVLPTANLQRRRRQWLLNARGPKTILSDGQLGDERSTLDKNDVGPSKRCTRSNAKAGEERIYDTSPRVLKRKDVDRTNTAKTHGLPKHLIFFRQQRICFLKVKNYRKNKKMYTGATRWTCRGPFPFSHHAAGSRWAHHRGQVQTRGSHARRERYQSRQVRVCAMVQRRPCGWQQPAPRLFGNTAAASVRKKDAHTRQSAVIHTSISG